MKNSGLREFSGFSYRIFHAGKDVSDTFVLLHGSGVDETTLLPFAGEITPRANLVAIRGRIPQEDGWRWFERITPTRFDQNSIRCETAAFAAFIVGLSEQQGFDAEKVVFLGYSNGANLISSLMLLHPGIVRQAILLRAMPVLDDPPATNLSQTRALVIAGAGDVTYGSFMPAIVKLLRDRDATVEARTVPLGHEYGDADAQLIRKWLQPTAAIALK